MRSIALVASLLLLSSVAACTPGRFTAEGLCEAEAKALCRFQFQCCNASERADLLGGDADYNDEASCVEVSTRSLCAKAGRTMDSVAAGRATWDESKAEACYGPLLDAMNACDAAGVFASAESRDACEAVVSGNVGDSGACFETYECATAGAICRVERSSDPSKQIVTSEGRCVPPAGEGQDCSSTPCAPDLYCAFGAMFEAPKCARLKAEGEACEDAQECRSMNCVVTTEKATCASKRASGEPCYADEQCQSGRCDYVAGTCAAEGESTMPTFDICTGEGD